MLLEGDELLVGGEDREEGDRLVRRLRAKRLGLHPHPDAPVHY